MLNQTHRARRHRAHREHLLLPASAPSHSALETVFGPLPNLLEVNFCGTKLAATCHERSFFESFHFLIGLFRGRPRGGDNFTFQVLQNLFSKRQKHPFSPEELQPRRGHPVKHPLISSTNKALRSSQFCSFKWPRKPIYQGMGAGWACDSQLQRVDARCD